MIRRLLAALRRIQSTSVLEDTPRFERGDLASIVTDDGQFGVVKILATDGEGVHVRLYVQRFAERPAQVDVSSLDTAPFGEGHDQPMSAGHLPISHRSFVDWRPELIQRGGTVSEEELEGYRIWEDARGGYF